MKINFFYAKHKHRMWKMKLKAFLMDLDDLDEKKIVSHKECELGKWINQYAWDIYKGYPEMKKLVERHELIHEIVAEVPRLKKAGKIKEAREKYDQLEEESEHLIGLMEIIQKNEEQLQSN